METYRNTPSFTHCGRYKDTFDMRTFVNRLNFPRPIGTPANNEARQIVCDSFAAIGKTTQLGSDLNNIVVGNPNTATKLVGAHYDTVTGTPGADDNTSALAVMLRIASNYEGDDICFVAFNGEEVNLRGSRDFVQNLGEHRLEQVHVLEMVGFRSFEPDSQRNPLPMVDLPTVGDFIGVVANAPLVDKIMPRANQINIPLIGLPLPEIAMPLIKNFAPHIFRSDHAPFWAAGIQAAMWTDTAEFRNSNYHSPADTPDTLDYDFMASVADAVLDVIS